MCSTKPSAPSGAATSSMTQSLGTLSLPILGICDAAAVLSVGTPGAVALAGVGDAGGWGLGAVNIFGELEEPDKLAKGLAAVAGGCWAGVS